MNKNVVLLSITGNDHPGITSSLTNILAETDTKILDIEQVVIHNTLSLSIIIELNSNTSNKAVLKELLFKAKEIGVELDFHVISEEIVINRSTRYTYVVTCIGEEITAGMISNLSTNLSKHDVNIERITKLNEGILNCIELIVYATDNININDVKSELLSLNKKYNVDIAFQRENIYRKSKRLIVLDMDMTLIQMEVIDEIAKRAGVEDKVKEITKRAMNGDIQFDTALKERVALLEGLDCKELEKVYNHIFLTDGAEDLIKIAKHLGYKIAVISGGFTFFTDRIKERLDLDYAFANELEIIDNKLTGKVKEPIVNAEAKAHLMEEIAIKENISIDQIIAVGDGANDLPMLRKAGLGVAFNAKQRVREEAKCSISSKPLNSILFLLGINEKDILSLSNLK